MKTKTSFEIKKCSRCNCKIKPGEIYLCFNNICKIWCYDCTKVVSQKNDFYQLAKSFEEMKIWIRIRKLQQIKEEKNVENPYNI